MKYGRLTGRTQFRSSFFGRAILQVEYCWHGVGAYERPSLAAVEIDRFDWRDADMEDLQSPALRWLLPKEAPK